jgi:hypothetical protein
MRFAGLATYMNVAITDPLQQRGLLAFDDTQLVLAGATAAAVLSGSVDIDGPSTAGNRAQPVDAVLLAALEEGLLYVVAVSRSCSGEDFSQAVSDRLAVCEPDSVVHEPSKHTP